MASNLPLEIIELILDIVANNDYHEAPTQYEFPNTKACALASRIFLHRCRQHIFHSIRVYDKPRTAKFSRNLARLFAQLITDNTEIPKYVRKLHYVIQTHNTALDYRVSPALARLTNLEQLTLSPAYGFFSWEGIKSSSRSTLFYLLHSQKVVSLRLIRIFGFMVSDLVQCTNITKLDLKHVFIALENDDVVSSAFPSSAIPLQHLGLKQTQTQIAAQVVKRERPDGRRILDLDRLKSISISIWSPDDLLSATEIFQGIQGLETIFISVAFMDDATDPILSLISPSLETLSSLNITVNTLDGSRDPLCGICRLFQLISGRNRIKVLDIFIRIPKHLDCSVGDEWGELERVLLNLGWPFLVQLDLRIIANGAREDLWLEKALRKLPQTQFQGLVSSKKVAFNFSADEGLPG